MRFLHQQSKNRIARQKIIRRNERVNVFLFFLIVMTVGVSNGCRSSTKIDLRKLVPGETLVYLETNNVARTLESLTASQALQSLAVTKPDFSALENMQLAVAVTGFETSEENAALTFKPRFVAVIETQAWSWQTASFARNQIDAFVKTHYGATAKLEITDKANGKFFAWTANDNRQAFAFVEGSLIYFGNDAAAIEACLAVKNGETESFRANEFFARYYSADHLAFGYVSPNGIAQIADFAGVALAIQTTEETSGRSFLTRLVPRFLLHTTREIVWTANASERGIEDVFTVSLTPETSATIKESLSAPLENRENLKAYLPPELFSATRYNLKNPLAAWRDALTLAIRGTDVVNGKLLNGFSGSLLEPYGIADAEMFLSSIDSEIITAQFDENNEKSVVIVQVKDAEKLKKSVSEQFDFNSAAERQENAEIRFSDERNFAAAFVKDKLILGDGESVLKCLRAGQNNQNFVANQKYQAFAESNSLVATFGRDSNSAGKIFKILGGGSKNENRKLATFYLTETNLRDQSFERKTVSDFGLIGTILKQFEQ